MSCLGIHMALGDHQARELESLSEEARITYLTDLESDLFEGSPDLVAETDKSWDALHRTLSDGELTWTGGTYPLNHAVLGGTVLYSKDDYLVSLKSPAQVKDIASALASLDRAHFDELYWRIDPASYDAELSEDDLDYTWSWFEGVAALFQRAAAANLSVVFMADQ